MAEEIGLKLSIDGGGASKTLKELKQEIKTLSNELAQTEKGSEAYRKLAQQVAKAKNEVKDLHEDIASFSKQGTFNEIAGAGRAIAGGFAAATGAMALFGVESENIQRQMLKVQASIAIVEGVKAATEGWEVAQRLLNLAMAANPIALMITAVATLAAGVAYLVSQQEEEVKILGENQQAYKNATAESDKYTESIVRTQREIDILNGKISKDEAERLNNADDFQKKFIAMRTRHAVELGDLERKLKHDIGIRDKAEYDRMTADAKKAVDDTRKQQLKAEQDFLDEYTKIRLKSLLTERKAEDKDAEEKRKKASDDAKRDLEERERNEKATNKFLEQIAEDRRANDEKTKQENQKAWEGYLNGLDKINKDEQSKQEEFNRFIEISRKQNDADALAKQKALAEAKLAIEKSLISSLNSLAVIFVNDNKKLQEVQKKLAVIQLAIDTAKGISGAVAQAQSVPFPANIGAIATGVAMVLANIAKAKQILSQAGASGGSVPSAGGGSVGGGVPSVPNPTENQTALQTNKQGQFTAIGQTNQVKAYVVESEFNSVQKKVTSIKNKALYE